MAGFDGALRTPWVAGYLGQASNATAGTMGSSSPSQPEALSDAALLEAIAAQRSQAAFRELFVR